MRPHNAMSRGIGTTRARPNVKEPDICSTIPTRSGPIVAARGVNVRVSPVANAISRGCRPMSNGIVITMGMTIKAKMPAQNSEAPSAMVLGVIRSAI